MLSSKIVMLFIVFFVLGVCFSSVKVVVFLMEMLLCVVLYGWYGWCDSSFSELNLYSVVRYSELILFMIVVLIRFVVSMCCVEVNILVFDEYVDEIIMVGLFNLKYVCINVVGE